MSNKPERLPDEISIVWTVEDIDDRDQSDTLTRNECREILDMIKRNHDASIGINWDVIDSYIQDFLNNKEE